MLSVVMLTKDRPDLFCRAADTLGTSPIIAERIVVQNGTDAETTTEALARGWTVRIYGRNTSFAEGNNRAAAEAVGSHLLLVNNDAILHPGCVDALWAYRERPIVGAFILDSFRRVNHAGITFQRRPDLVGLTGSADYPFPRHVGRGYSPHRFVAGQEPEAVTFACVLIHRALWQTLGGLDEAYWYGMEDVDFCLRAREHGVGCVVPLGARVTHDEFGTRTTVTDLANIRRFLAQWPLDRIRRALGSAALEAVG